MKALLGALMGLLLLPFLLATLLFALVGAALAPLGQDEPRPGPVDWSGVATIHDLGFGPSDAERVDRMIRSIRPNSPLVGQGAHLVTLGARYRVDPLLIALWAYESEMALTGINSPENGGNMTWAAAQEATQLYGCTPGPSSLGHLWAKCPTVPAGLSLWVDYVGTYYPARGKVEFYAFANTYNPCSDPANGGRFLCGDGYADAILKLIADHAGYAGGAGPINTAGEWYRYQGETSSYDAFGNETSNCGPSTVAMAIKWRTGTNVPIRNIRSYIGTNGYTSIGDLQGALANWGVASRRTVAGTADIPAALHRGSIVIIGVDMSVLSLGRDANGAGRSPSVRLEKYITTNVMHFIVVKGVARDGRHLIIHDPNVWGDPTSARYWYSDGTAKGRDRLYTTAELNVAMMRFTSYPGNRALEVTR
jgi:hypothetical protein